MDTTFRTYSGLILDLEHPTREAIRWTDMVQGICHLARFAGQTYLPYTVAQHSVNVAVHLRALGEKPAIQWEGLCHDLEEAYPPGDICERIKHLPSMMGALTMQKRIRAVIVDMLMLPDRMSEVVHEADKWALECEQEIVYRRLMNSGAFWPPSQARMMFNMTAILIASEMQDNQPIRDMLRDEVKDATAWIGFNLGFLHPRTSPPAGGWENRLASELNEVFNRYGLNPSTPAFASFIDSLDKINRPDPPKGKGDA